MRKIFTLFLLLGITMFPVVVNAQFSGGDGTELNPYKITTITDLNNVRDYMENHFELLNDLDFEGTDFDSLNSTDHAGWIPIDDYSGAFNGNGYAIKNLYINRSDYDTGLFGDIYDATIMNLGIENCKVSGNFYVGGLVGYGRSITIRNCYSTGNVFASRSNVGGLIGLCTGSNIDKCFSNAEVTGSDTNGGLIGWAYDNSIVKNSYATGNVNGQGWSAGLVGYTEETMYVNCYSTSKLSNSYSEGLIGSGWKCEVINSYWDTDISGVLSSDGGEGKSSSKLKLNSTFSEWDFDSIWIMAVNPEVDLLRRPYFRNQQLPGYEIEVVHDNPNDVLINGEGLYSNGDLVSLSILAYNLTFNNWKLEGSNVSTSNPYQFTFDTGNSHVYTADFSIQNTPPVVAEIPDQNVIYVVTNNIKLDDYVTDLTNHDYEILWSVSGNENFNIIIERDRSASISCEAGYNGSETITLTATDPEGLSASVSVKLNAYTFSGGQGLETDPFQITNLNQLDSIRYALGSHYLLMNDLDFLGSEFDSLNSLQHNGWVPIGDYDVEYFEGSFDGNGHLIKNLYIDESNFDSYGLFGSAQNASIKNLGIVNCNLTGEYYTGALIGYAYETNIESCYVTGKVKADAYSGGLIGQLGYGSILNNCYSTARVIGGVDYDFVGGLVGNNQYSLISNCYAVGNVTGDPDIGGLVGHFESYNSTISDCFYNTETTGLTDVDRGDPLTTSQMKSSFTYLLAGWDLSSVWGILDNKTYPALMSVDNVPFVFNERLFDLNSITFSDLLANDYDFETGQDNLVLEILNISGGNFTASQISLPAALALGDSISITYRIGETRIDENDVLWSQSVTSYLIKGNRAPEVSVQNLSVNEDNTLILDFDEIAYDVDNDEISFSIITQSVNGSTVLQNGKFIYTPNENFFGKDSVQIEIEDYSENTVTWITYNVESVNDTPQLLVKDSLTVNEDTAIEISLNNFTASDVDGDLLFMQINSGANYTFVGSTITPTQDFNGVLNVNVVVSDLVALSNVVALQVNVLPINDAPQIVSTLTKTMLEDSSIIINLNDITVSEVDGDEVTLSILSGDNYTVNDSLITPDSNFNGTLNVALKINDGILDSELSNLSLEVTPVNDAPVLMAVIPQTTNEDEAITLGFDAIDATDVDGDELFLLIEAGDNFTVEGSTVTPNTNFYGTLNLTVKVSDGKVESDTLSMLLTVNSVNDAPIVVSALEDIIITESTSISLVGLFSDVEGDVLTLDVMIEDQTLIEASIENELLNLNIISNLKGTAEVVVVADDGFGGFAYDTINVTVDFKTGINNYFGRKDMDLVSIYPNPFNNVLSVKYNLLSSGSVKLTLFQLTGAVVNYTDLGFINEGEHLLKIDTEGLSSGVYFMKINTNGQDIGLIKAIKVE